MESRNFYLSDIPLDELRQGIETALRAVGRWEPLPGEEIPLIDALGRITAAPVWARISAPHYHAAAMDGFAVWAADTQNATETRPLALELGKKAFNVDTGDPLPPHTNAVIMIEQVQHSAGNIEVRAAVAPWAHVRMMGEDMVQTEMVLPANHRLRPVDLGAAAGSGNPMLLVRRQPLVLIIPTGDELIPASQAPQAGQIIEYNSLVLRGQIIEIGGRVALSEIVPDDPEKLKRALQKALAQKPDMVLILSGSSAGSADHTAAIVAEMGALLAHGVAVRPGHPVIAGMVDDVLVFGVPGYPVSAALTGEILIQPQLARWLGIPAPIDTRPRLSAIMTRKLVSHTGDDDFVRMTLAQVGEKLLAAPLSRGAGVISSLVRADGLAHIPRFSEGVDMGQAVNVMLYRPLEEIRQTLLIMGSHDPMLDLLAQFLAERGTRLSSAHVGSMGGLVALRRDEAHLAGSHLMDEENGEYNISYVQKYLPETPVQLVTFAHREQGFLVARGNPLGVAGWGDLPRLRYVNRQKGSGTRVLLDFELRQRGIDPATIGGYEREEYTHLGVAAAVASGSADCGLGLRSGALALGLDFISVAWERYDFVIPQSALALPGVGHLLDLLQDGGFRAALAAQPGYDTQQTGRICWNSTPLYNQVRLAEGRT